MSVMQFLLLVLIAVAAAAPIVDSDSATDDDSPATKLDRPGSLKTLQRNETESDNSGDSSNSGSDANGDAYFFLKFTVSEIDGSAATSTTEFENMCEAALLPKKADLECTGSPGGPFSCKVQSSTAEQEAVKNQVASAQFAADVKAALEVDGSFEIMSITVLDAEGVEIETLTLALQEEAAAPPMPPSTPPSKPPALSPSEPPSPPPFEPPTPPPATPPATPPSGPSIVGGPVIGPGLDCLIGMDAAFKERRLAGMDAGNADLGRRLQAVTFKLQRSCCGPFDLDARQLSEARAEGATADLRTRLAAAEQALAVSEQARAVSEQVQADLRARLAAAEQVPPAL